jgi:CCR4-NOT transcription complex subunit 7/8
MQRARELKPSLTTTYPNLPSIYCSYSNISSPPFPLSHLSDDMYAQDSIDLLTNSGINFSKHEQFGIDVEVFGEVLTSSGLVLLDDVKWISFHSGYDFGYLLKVLTCNTLPVEETDFFTLLKTYFPCIYDIKFLMKSCKTLKGGLQEVADDLKVRRGRSRDDVCVKN